MTTTNSEAVQPRTGVTMPNMEDFQYKTIEIFPNFFDVGGALSLLKQNGFTDDQISLLGREQKDWQENINNEWDALKTAKGTLEGAALGSIPGLILVAGTALTGGVGLLVAGPMAAMVSLGLGTLGGGLIGATLSNIDAEEELINVDQQVEDAIRLGQWVLIAHCHDHKEAVLAQKLLNHGRIVPEFAVADEI